MTTTNDRNERRKVSWWQFPGWWGVAVGTIQSFVGYGFPYYGWSAFVPPLQHEFGWNATMMGALGSTGRLVGMVAYPLGGWMTDAWGPRLSAILWLAVMAIGWFALMPVTEYWQLVAVYSFLLYGTVSGGLYRISFTAVNRFFARKRAAALGIIAFGTGFGSTILVPLTAVWVSDLGWRTTALVLGVITFVTCVPISWLFVTRMPEDYGLYVDNETPEEMRARAAEKRTTIPVDISTPQALRSLSFWMLCLGGFWASLAAAPLPIFQNTRMQSIGFNLVEAAIYYGFNLAFSSIGRAAVAIVGDWVSARVAPRLVLFLTYMGAFVGLLAFGLATNVWYVWVWVVFYGFFQGVSVPYLGYMVGAYFGRSSFGLIYGLRTSVAAIGGAISPWMVGWLRDVSDDWILPFVIASLGLLLAAVFYGLATPPQVQRASSTVSQT